MKPVIVPFFIAHQGCPHTCVFCNQIKISGAAAALPTPAEILGRIALYRRTSRERGVEAAFFGGTFTSLPLFLQERLLTPLQPLLERGDLAAVRVSTRPDAVDRKTAEFLSSRGSGRLNSGCSPWTTPFLPSPDAVTPPMMRRVPAAYLPMQGSGWGFN